MVPTNRRPSGWPAYWWRRRRRGFFFWWSVGTILEHMEKYGNTMGKSINIMGYVMNIWWWFIEPPFFDIFSVFQNDDMVYLPLVYGHLLGKNAGKTSLYFGDDHNPWSVNPWKTKTHLSEVLMFPQISTSINKIMCKFQRIWLFGFINSRCSMEFP
jgi:hypothetical protein